VCSTGDIAHNYVETKEFYEYSPLPLSHNNTVKVLEPQLSLYTKYKYIRKGKKASKFHLHQINADKING